MDQMNVWPLRAQEGEERSLQQGLIYHRKLRRGVEILHIFHGARNREAAGKTSMPPAK